MNDEKQSGTPGTATVYGTAIAFIVVALVALGLRLVPLMHQSLWVDEIFSLAMATGHSLERAASLADPAMGDYVEPLNPVPAAYFAQYLKHEQPPESPDLVLRAVLYSDTSPPLYYLLVSTWTRAFGTSDAALRFFSVLFSLASLPLMAAYARSVAGVRAVWPAVLFFALAPASVFYGTEGRMYSLLMFLSIAQAMATFSLSALQADRRMLFLLWCLVGAAGLLTHYFFVFVWAPMAFWLFLHTRERLRRQCVLAVLFTLVLVSPWYRLLPEAIANSTHAVVTSGWLSGYPSPGQAMLAPLWLMWRNFPGNWANWPGALGLTDYLLLPIVLALVIVLVVRVWRRDFSPAHQLIVLWLLGACLGPAAVDLLMNTWTSLVPRYALAGLPAATLLAASALAYLPRWWRLAGCFAIIGLWLPALIAITTAEYRFGQPFQEVAAAADSWAGPEDVILIQSIPSGVIGVARYLKGPAPVFSWVEQLHVRTAPADMQRLVEGRQRIVLVTMHTVGAPQPARQWLERNARVARRWHKAGAEVSLYEIRSGKTNNVNSRFEGKDT